MFLAAGLTSVFSNPKLNSKCFKQQRKGAAAPIARPWLGQGYGQLFSGSNHLSGPCYFPCLPISSLAGQCPTCNCKIGHNPASHADNTAPREKRAASSMLSFSGHPVLSLSSLRNAHRLTPKPITGSRTRTLRTASLPHD